MAQTLLSRTPLIHLLCTDPTNVRLNFSSNDHGFGDVNISAILNSFQMGYDKRVRPNYGGESRGKV